MLLGKAIINYYASVQITVSDDYKFVSDTVSDICMIILIRCICIWFGVILIY